MMLAVPFAFFAALLALASVRSQRRSSRVGALLALTVLLVLLWGATGLAYAMTDDRSLIPALTGAALIVFITILGCIAFRRKPH